MIFNSSKYNTDWNTKRLSDLGKFQRGKSRHRPRNDSKLFEHGTYPLVQTGAVKATNLYIRTHEACYNDFGLSQSTIWPENTLCITIAANIAETALLGYPMCFPDSIVGFNAYPEESSELFMHYVFTYIRKAIQNSASGSIQDNINIEYLTGLRFKIPHKTYQDKITEILSSIDKKIELNNRINAELEAMAKTLYEYWFVQFDFPDVNGKPYKASGGKMVYNPVLKREIPANWKVQPITDCCEVVDCLHSKKPGQRFVSPDYFLLQLENIRDDGLVDVTTKYFVSQEDYSIWTSRIEVKKHDVVMTNAGRIAAFAQIPSEVKCGIGRNITAIRPYDIGPNYFFSCLSGFYIQSQILTNLDHGAFFKSFNVKGIKALNIIRPPSAIEGKFEQLISPLIEKRQSTILENQKLTSLRDWLLPMLMNGQVTVKPSTEPQEAQHG